MSSRSFGFWVDCKNWLVDTFGDQEVKNKQQRSQRFLEEALELVQACDMSKETALKLVEYVYGRPKGDIEQEVGGVMVTLACHAAAFGYHPSDCGWTEIDRCWEKQDRIREKQKTKPVLEA